MNTREALDKIDDLLAELPDPVQCEVMTVLTALRGPDTICTDRAKNATVLIRVTAFPKTFAKRTTGLIVNVQPHLRNTVKPSHHFETHAYCAAITLDVSQEFQDLDAFRVDTKDAERPRFAP